MNIRRLVLWACLDLAVCIAVVAARASDPDALWKIVHGQCVVTTTPCVALDTADGVALLKDRVGVSQYLLIPTERVTGIEDPQILSPVAPNYFALAWGYDSKVGEALHQPLPRDDLSLAINSKWGRSQNQLHIHIDCVRTDVHEALAAHAAAIGARWQPFPVPLAGHGYQAMRITGADLGANNPFKLIAATTPDMGDQTLVLVGASFADGPGFILLDDHVDLVAGDRASGEELQDHGCAIAKPR